MLRDAPSQATATQVSLLCVSVTAMSAYGAYVQALFGTINITLLLRFKAFLFPCSRHDILLSPTLVLPDGANPELKKRNVGICCIGCRYVKYN